MNPQTDVGDVRLMRSFVNAQHVTLAGVRWRGPRWRCKPQLWPSLFFQQSATNGHHTQSDLFVTAWAHTVHRAA